MDFSNLVQKQPKAFQLINNSFKNDRLAQVHLFYGEKGTSKMEMALYLASLVLCQAGGACGICNECQKIDKLINPNIFIIAPDGESIKKEQVDNLEHEFSMTSDYQRVFIIKDIEKATLSSANSLLKFLESLPNNCYGILLSENINEVLPTIKSRALLVHFLSSDKSLIAQALMKNNLEKDYALAIAQLTNNLEEAKKLAADKMIIQIIELVKIIGSGIEQDIRRIYLDMVEKGDFLKNVDKGYNNYFLDLLICFQNDKLKKILNLTKNIIFQDSLENIAITLSQQQEIKILEILLEYRQKLKYNVNIELLYTQMLIEIGRVK